MNEKSSHRENDHNPQEGDDLIRQFLALLDDSQSEEERVEKVRLLINGVILGVVKQIEREEVAG